MSSLPSDATPRAVWWAHTVTLVGLLTLGGLLAVGTVHDPLNRLFVLALGFLPLGIAYALFSTWLVRRGGRVRPLRATWRILLPAHAVGLLAGLLAARLFLFH